MHRLLTALALSVGIVAMLPASSSVTLTPLGTASTGTFRDADPRNAEINAYDPFGQRIYVVNPQFGRLDVIDISNPAAPTSNPSNSIDLVAACEAVLGAAGCPLDAGAEPNSVDIHGDLMAVAVANAVRTNNGHAVFFQLQGTNAPVFIAALEVGALPDMIAFSDDGGWVVTANEGEPNLDYTIDPPGSVSIIKTSDIASPSAVRTVGFERFDNPGQRQLAQDGVRIFGPGASVTQDLEPEYVAIAGNKVFVTLQENNALAIINIDDASVEKVVGLGLKDHSLSENELDPNDQNGIALGTFGVFGLYQPDAIAAIAGNGRQFLIMANEGDAREYTGSPGYVEAVRLSNSGYPLDPTTFPNGAALKSGPLGRLNVSKGSGDIDGDGDFDRIDVFGGRSVSVRDQQGRLVWDSGDFLERLSEAYDALKLTVFNISNSSNARDNRSDDKGIEPESVVVGEVGGRSYAFVGLERDSGIVVLDVSTPSAPAFVTYMNNRKFPVNSSGGFLSCNSNICGDLGPEGLTFVKATDSPTGEALLIVSNEVSSTTTIWEVK